MSTPKVEKEFKTVSFSQYSMWLGCPHQWKLNYIDGLRTYEDSLHTLFGTAIHECLQNYLSVLYSQGAPFADSLNLTEDFNFKFKKGIIDSEQVKNFKKDDVFEFIDHGKLILEFFVAPLNRKKYFPSKQYEIVGVELPLDVNLRPNISYKGYIDVVLRDRITKKIKILDFKTSTVGWGKNQQKDPKKIDQLLLYKKFYSDIFNIPLNMIDVEYIILKRKLWENSNYPQSRVVVLEPSSGKPSINKAMERFESFLDNCFTVDGAYNKNAKFEKNPGEAKKNCKYCPYFKTTHCDSKPE